MSKESKKSRENEVCEDDALEVKRAMLLNAMADPGGIDTALTASDQPIADGGEQLNQTKRS